MHDTALDSIPIQLTSRLENWLEKRKADMEHVLYTSGNSIQAPIDDYSSLYTFNQEKFLMEYNMYVSAYEGIKVVNQYKTEQSGA
jgi:hypothetical protein